MSRLEVWAPEGLPEVAEGDDVAALVAEATDLRDGDVVLVTSKVVSKAEGRLLRGDRDGALEKETARVVARRGATVIVRNRLGLTMAAAGIDASNVPAGWVALLPLDPDASARRIRTRLGELTGRNVGVVITDTAGRAWRVGQTDIAVGAAGLVVAEDFAGRTDPHGNPLAVTLPAVADELASAAELVQGKLSGRPVAVVRGRADLVLPAGHDGLGAAALVRDEGADLFGYGAREAVVRALAGRRDDQPPFGTAVDPSELLGALGEIAPVTAMGSGLLMTFDDSDEVAVRLPHRPERVAVDAVAFAHGWCRTDWADLEDGVRVHFRPASP